MIKLQDILKEEKTFKAKSKETGRIVVYKSKEARDKAIKAGKSEPVDKKKSDKQTDKLSVKGKSLFMKQLSPIDPETGKPKDTSKNLKSTGPQAFVDDVRKMEGDYDLGEVKIKDGKMFDADGNEMDDDDIEDFYYQHGYDERGINVGIEMGPKKEKSEDEIFKPRDESWFDDFAEKNPKFKEKMDKKYRNKNHTSDDYYIFMLKLEEKIEKIRNKWMKENPGKRIPGTLTTKLGDESEYLMDSAQKMAAHETGNDYADFRWSNKWAIEMDRKHLPNMKEVKENRMKLKSLLKEAKVWERKFGEPLPTLNSVMEKHQQKEGGKGSGRKAKSSSVKNVSKKTKQTTHDKEMELKAMKQAFKDMAMDEVNEQGVLSQRAGINVFGGKQLQLMAKGLRQTAFDLEKVAKKKDEQAFDNILQRITITVGVMRSFLNKPKRRM